MTRPDASLKEILKELIEAAKTLEHISLEGWSKGEKERVQGSKGSYEHGDPVAAKELRYWKRRWREDIQEIWGFLNRREEKRKGPYYGPET